MNRADRAFHEDLENEIFLALKLEIASVNRSDIYRQAIKRTFADLYGVSPERWMLAGRPARPSLCSAPAKHSFIQF